MVVTKKKKKENRRLIVIREHRIKPGNVYTTIYIIRGAEKHGALKPCCSKYIVSIENKEADALIEKRLKIDFVNVPHLYW